MKIASSLIFAIINMFSSNLRGDVLQDTCDTGVQDTILVGSVQVPGPLWPDSIGVPIFIWADEPIAAFSWGLRPLDSRIRVSSFSKSGSVFPAQMFIPTLVDTVNNRIGFGWVDFMGTDPADSPQGLVGTIYFKIDPVISVGESLNLDSASIGPAYRCRLTVATPTGSFCESMSVTFDDRGVDNVIFGHPLPETDIYFSFDEGAGSIVYDRSGHMRDGVLHSQPSWVTGVMGGALRFDGVDDYVEFEPLYSFPYYGPLTVSCWFKPAQRQTTRQCLAFYGGAGEWEVAVLNDSIRFGLNFADIWSYVAVPLPGDSNWYHMAAIWRTAQSLALYLNGDSITQLAIPNSHLGGAQWGTGISLGNIMSLYGANLPYAGILDEFLVSKRALTSNEILQEYLRVNYVACGDADASRRVNIADVVFLVNYIFAGGAAPPQLASADVTCNGSIDITDVVYLVNYFFAGGAVPCAACP